MPKQLKTKEKKSTKKDGGETDYYGFTNDYQYDRTVDYKTKRPKRNLKYTLTIIAIGFISIIVIFMLITTGWIAWNQFINDPMWLKLFKTWLSVLFAPIFLFYIFVKTVIFKLPN